MGWTRRKTTTLLAVVSALAVLAGCGTTIPADPDGTLDRVTGGTLRVGVSHQPPWTDITGDGEPSGTEAGLVRDFADSLDAEVEWETGGEEHLIHLLEEEELDVVIGGLTKDSPWERQVALTTSYREATGPAGETSQHVMAVPMGENAFMTALERFLLAEGEA
ncbi:transporter substrate-binding domain-containing protein [Rothia halotolerans]|uniref:transporter substrate-binding domain-containing protein n=1 Tax=Rothia halotolerans TaxID=405770 RepID=UPI00101CECF5|nr:transporter substrate-binding domain-containing protein [Rothia halotolerans]